MSAALKTVVSRVSNARATATSDVVVGDVLYEIGQGAYQAAITKIRKAHATGDASTVKALKKKLPAITFSGRFKKRSADGLLSHSGLLCADLDDVGDVPAAKAKLLPLPSLFAAFASPTGGGIKAVFRVPADASAHLDSFRAVEKLVKDATGHDIDQLCKDIPRLCFVSHDPDIYLNTDAEEVRCTHRTHSPHTPHIPHNPHISHSVVEREQEPRVAAPHSIANLSTVEKAVAISVPTARGMSHKCFFKLAGALKAMEKHTAKEFGQSELRPILHSWFVSARSNIDPNKSESDCYLEFLDAWNNANPMREGIVEQAWRLSEKDDRPPELTPDLDNPRFARFAAFLRRLQILMGDSPFYLSPYKAAAIMGHPNHSTASLWIGALRATKIITRITPGVTRKSAASYRYNFQSAEGPR